METYKKLNIITAILLITNVALTILSIKYPILILLILLFSVVQIILSIISICKKRNIWAIILLVVSILMVILFGI